MAERNANDGVEVGSLLPLTPLSFNILLALADADRHGYGIIKEIEARTGEPMRSGTGTLYLAIQRLENEALIEPAPPPPDPRREDARRRYYRLTSLGRAAAEAEAERLAGLVGVASRKRLLSGATLAAILKPGARSTGQ